MRTIVLPFSAQWSVELSSFWSSERTKCIVLRSTGDQSYLTVLGSTVWKPTVLLVPRMSASSFQFCRKVRKS